MIGTLAVSLFPKRSCIRSTSPASIQKSFSVWKFRIRSELPVRIWSAQALLRFASLHSASESIRHVCRISGVLSAQTRNTLQVQTFEYLNRTSRVETNFLDSDGLSMDDNNNHALVYFNQQCVPDKIVARALEALAGVYLKVHGRPHVLAVRLDDATVTLAAFLLRYRIAASKLG